MTLIFACKSNKTQVQNTMKRKDDSIWDILHDLPWWASVAVAVLAFVTLKYIFPFVGPENPAIREIFKTAGPNLAPFFAFIFMLIAAFSFFHSRRQKKLHEAHKKALSSKQKNNMHNKLCPQCGNELVLRTAEQGPDAGNEFWGCTDFPGCRYTDNYDDFA